MKKLSVGVIFGGKSAEHEVSIVSAQSVMDALDRSRYDVVPIGITRGGEWVAGEHAVDTLKKGGPVREGCSIPIAFATEKNQVGSSRVDLQACKLEYSIVSPK